MGLFSSKEEKEQKKEEKDQKKLEKLNVQMAKYGLENLSRDDKETIRLILLGLMGTGMMETGAKLTGIKSEDDLKITYLRTLMEQNWLLLKKLDEISRKLDK